VYVFSGICCSRTLIRPCVANTNTDFDRSKHWWQDNIKVDREDVVFGLDQCG
jgi:hypothetical protein